MAKLTKAQIVLAAQENVGRGSELDVICDTRLNLVLDQLFENYTWEGMTRVNSSISLAKGSNSWTVPSNYVKAKLFTYVDNEQTVEVPIIDYTDISLMDLQSSSEDRPQFMAVRKYFADDGSVTLEGYVYPKPNKAITGTLLYYHTPTFDTADGNEVMVWDIKSVVDLLTNELKGMGYGNQLPPPYDPDMINKVIGRMRRNEVADEGIYPKIARLDRRRFRRSPYSTRVTRWPQDLGNA